MATPIPATAVPTQPHAATPYRCPVCGRMSPARADAPVRPGCYACGKVDTTPPLTAALSVGTTDALPTITIMAPRQLRSTPGHFSPTLVQVPCSNVSLSAKFRTKRIAREYVAGLVAAGKVVFVATEIALVA